MIFLNKKTDQDCIFFGGGVGGHFSSASFQLIAQEIPAFGILLSTVGQGLGVWP